MNVEQISLLPGFNNKCNVCTKQLKAGPFESGFPCRAAWAPLGNPLQPRISVAPDGSFTCDRYRPNLPTFIKNLVGRRIKRIGD